MGRGSGVLGRRRERRFRLTERDFAGGERVVIDASLSLICAGWSPQERTLLLERTAGLESSVTGLQDKRIAHRAFAGRSQALPPSARFVRTVMCRSQVSSTGKRPAPAGQFPGDGGVGHHGTLLAGLEVLPPSVRPPVCCLTASPCRRAGGVPTATQIGAGAIGLAVMPGRLDQQPVGMAVAGLGDGALRAGGAREILRRDETEVGADRTTGRPVPIPDLDREPSTSVALPARS